MIIFFGPAGAGKSIQGQIIAARHGWRWLSAGQLLRDSNNPEIARQLKTGDLLDAQLVNHVMAQALQRSKDIKKVILDGFPRQLEQAQWLIQTQTEHGRLVDLVVVFDVPETELIQRLQLRGRADDAPETVAKRLQLHSEEIAPILNYFTEQGIKVVHVDGAGTIGEVHDRVEAELVACSLV